jgi:hypothetical protein
MIHNQREAPAAWKTLRQKLQQRRGIAAAGKTDAERPGAQTRFVEANQGLALAAGASNPATKV